MHVYDKEFKHLAGVYRITEDENGECTACYVLDTVVTQIPCGTTMGECTKAVKLHAGKLIRLQRINAILRDAGYEIVKDVDEIPNELIETWVFDSVVPGVCKNCNGVEDVEPDCTEGWCSECNTNSIVSALIILGII